MRAANAPRVVFDCMVFLQGAARRTSPAKACLDLAEEGLVELCLSVEILAEVRDVLTRPETQRKFPALLPPKVDEAVLRLSAKAMHFSDVPAKFRYERDPKDEPYINLAIAAEAKYLVTRDNDLLALMDDSKETGKSFRSDYPFLTILDPASFLKQIRDQSRHPDQH